MRCLLNRIRVAIPAAAVLIVAGLWWERGARAQTGTPLRWEFATVEGLFESVQGRLKHSAANICFHTEHGCRWDTVRVSVDRTGMMQDAVAAATARLGERGWEVVSVTPPYESRPLTMVMKRARPDSP